jgi:hypothetical protein
MRALRFSGVVIFVFHGRQSTEALPIRRQVICGQMRVSLHHLRARPAAHFLQRKERRTVLHVPTRPGVPQIVPAKVFNPHLSERRIPRLGLRDRFATVAKNMRRAVYVRLRWRQRSTGPVSLSLPWLGRDGPKPSALPHPPATTASR